jgi:hypothetical protein
LRLTPPFNLPAPGRRQPLYIVFTTLQRPVFLLNSRLMRFAATSIAGGTPSPEVTGLICLVPEQTITRAPENTHLDYLCRFVVRILPFSLAAFPGSRPGGLTFPDLRSPWFETIPLHGLPSASPHRSLSNESSYGILTVCPSATPFGLTLGSGSP